MLKRTLVRLLIGAAVAVPVVAIPAAGAAAAPSVAAVETLFYDDSRAAEFQPAVTRAVAIWNAQGLNVRLERVRPGARAEITLVVTNGWPMATLGPVHRGGRGTVWLGRQATAQGHNATRIAAHELGHNLGLPDRKPGPCSSLMSGSSAGASCTNAVPNATERAAVARSYPGVAAARAPEPTSVILVDAA